MISFYVEAVKAIDKGVSPWVKYLVGTIALLCFFVTTLISLNNENPIYEFSLFCALLAALCFTSGKTQRAIGKLISLTLVLISFWYLYFALTYTPGVSDTNFAPSFGKAFLFFCFIGLPALSYLWSGKLVNVKPKNPKKNYKRRKR